MKTKEDKMGRECNKQGGRGMHMESWWESQKERDK
jgi:hypothetical protein